MRVYGPLSFVTRPPVLAGLFVAYLLCTVGFSYRSRELGLGNEVPDTRLCTSREELKQLLDRLGEGRQLYALTECSLDLAFPLAYGGLFAGFLPYLYPRRAARLLALLPLLAVAADLSENLHYSHLACHFEDYEAQAAVWYWTAVLSTGCKCVFFALSILALLIGIAGGALGGWVSVLRLSEGSGNG